MFSQVSEICAEGAMSGIAFYSSSRQQFGTHFSAKSDLEAFYPGDKTMKLLVALVEATCIIT